MPKNIVFCADGTWNGPGKVTVDDIAKDCDDAGELGPDATTNVYKLFCNLAGVLTLDSEALSKEQEKELRNDGCVTQVAKYIHGVGDSSNAIDHVFGGVVGAGVISRIVRGYTFISRHYQPGDAIYIVGFSRGAYTARALAGMISRVGLLDASKYNVNDKEEAYRRGRAAWEMSRSLAFTGSNPVSRLMTRAAQWLGSWVSKKTLSKSDLIAPVSIKAVGVWDTVGSMGVPLYLSDGRTDMFRFTDQVLSNQVEYGFHAMAIDELRKDFPVTPWQPRTNISQVWFVGAHADVGGGYSLTESRLSDVTLEWMMRKLGGVGVIWQPQLACTPDCDSTAFLSASVHEPWSKPPFNVLGNLARQARAPEPGDVYHVSVRQRWDTGTYRPQALSWNATTMANLRIDV